MSTHEIAKRCAEFYLEQGAKNFEEQYKYSAALGSLIGVIGGMLTDLKHEFPKAYEKVVKNINESIQGEKQ